MDQNAITELIVKKTGLPSEKAAPYVDQFLCMTPDAILDDMDEADVAESITDILMSTDIISMETQEHQD